MNGEPRGEEKPTVQMPVTSQHPDPRSRAKVLVGTGLLVVLQLVHLLDVLRYDETASFPAVLGDPLAMFGIGGAMAGFVWTARRWRSARTVSGGVAGAIALGFLLQHGLPFDLGGVNNPYWTFDGNRADLFRWATVLVLIALGAWTARTAWRALPLDDAGPRLLAARSG